MREVLITITGENNDIKLNASLLKTDSLQEPNEYVDIFISDYEIVRSRSDLSKVQYIKFGGNKYEVTGSPKEPPVRYFTPNNQVYSLPPGLIFTLRKVS